MKRLSALFLSLVMALSLTACGGSTDDIVNAALDAAISAVEDYGTSADIGIIGGDRFGNREGLLPEGEYTECDLNTLGEDERGAERLVFSDDGRYYHTEDHYASFTKVWVEDGEVIW